jgi:protein gp37
MQCVPCDWGNGWDNVWLGTSVGSQESIERAIVLLRVEAKMRFLSLEPMHGAIDLYPEIPDHFEGYNGASKVELLTGRLTDMARPCGYLDAKIDWVIIGGESGNENGKYRYRPCNLDWIESLVRSCKYHKSPVFVKQLGTHLAKQLKLKDRHGGEIDEFPEYLRVREFPKLKTDSQ